MVECIVNVSEGRNTSTLDAIAQSIKKIPQVHLLHIDIGESANRTVFTFAGEVEQVFTACKELFIIANASIDMQEHTGSHPRIGAVDVCPFVALSGISKEELIVRVEEFAKALSTELDIGIFLYEDSAKNDSRRNLADHRQGQYEKLVERISSGSHPLDYGRFQAHFGACVMGVRNFLLAYNVNIKSKDLNLAKKIAYSVRSSSWPQKMKKEGLFNRIESLPHLKAIAWEVPEYNLIQVSTNLSNFKQTGLHQAYEAIKKAAQMLETDVMGSELIGLVPLEAILDSGSYYLPEEQNEAKLIRAAIDNLGLSAIKDFNAMERILEYRLKDGD